MGEQRQACIVTAEVHLYDIAVDRLFEHGSLLRHRIGVQADVQDLQVCLLHTAGIGIYGLLLGKQQIHVHHETVAGLSQWQLAGRDPVYLIFDTPHVYQLQMTASAITDRFVEAALYVKQPDGTSAVFDRYVDLLIAARHLQRRDGEQHPFDAVAQGDRRVCHRFADCRDHCFFVRDLLICYTAHRYPFHTKDVQSRFEQLTDDETNLMVGNFQSRVDFLSAHRRSSLLHNTFIIIS